MGAAREDSHGIYMNEKKSSEPEEEKIMAIQRVGGSQTEQLSNDALHGCSFNLSFYRWVIDLLRCEKLNKGLSFKVKVSI